MSTDERELNEGGWGETGMTRRATLLAGAAGVGGLLLAQGGLAGPAAAAHAAPRRPAARRPRRRRQGRVVQPGPRLVVHRRLARLQHLRPAGARQSGLLAVARASRSSWTPNADATVCEVKLRPDVKWHDGSPFTADDVICSLRQMGDAKHVGSRGRRRTSSSPSSRRPSRSSLQIPLKGPDARLSDSFVQQGTVIIKNGTTTFAKPIGTGPFKFKSFEVGERSLCVRNPDYWDERQAVRRRVGGHLDRRQRRRA